MGSDQTGSAALGYVAVGFAIPLTLAGFLIVDVAFLPGKNGRPPMLGFSADEPLAVVVSLMLLGAAALWVVAALCLRRKKSTSSNP